MKPLTSNRVIKGFGLKLKQRGLIADFYLYGIVILLILGSLAGLYWKVHHDGYEQGKAETLEKWSAASRQAEEAATAARKARQAEADKADKDLASASNKAADFESRWRAARNAHPVLATVICPTAGTGNVAGIPSAADPSGDGIRLSLTDNFLFSYDSIWTGQDGKSLFPNPRIPADPSDAAVTLDALLDTHAENASRCSQNSRQLNALIDLLTTLRKHR